MKSVLSSIVLLIAVTACGCNKEDAKQAGEKTQDAAEKTGAVIDKGLNKLGTAANEGIRDANQAAIEAKPHIQAASTQGTHDLGNMAREAGHVADRAGEKIHDTLAPATQPAR